MSRLSGITRIAAAALIALALGSCAMNAQQQQAPPSQQSQQPSTNPGVSGQTGSTLEPDPNFPGVASPPGLKVQWSQYVPGRPDVLILDPQVLAATNDVNGKTQYIGWNDQGSWLVGLNGKIYVWNLAKNSLTYPYNNYKQIPQDIVDSLRNSPYKVAKNTTPPAKAVVPEPQTPDTSRQAAFFGGSGNLTQAAPSGAITGSGAAIQNGVLTFTRADNTKASYKVVRPKVAQGAPGNTGTWIAMEDAGKGILFTVQSDGSLTGHEMPAQLIQMLSQAPAR